MLARKNLHVLARLMPAAELVEQELRGIDVPLDRLQRLAGDQGHADRRRQVIDLADAVEQRCGPAPHRRPSRGRASAADDSRTAARLSQPAGRFVIDDRDPVAAGQQRLGQMRADESRAAGDQDICHSVALVVTR